MVFPYFILFYRSSDDLSGSPGSPIQRLMQEFMPNAPKRPPPRRRRRRNPDDSGYVPDLDEVPGIPVQLVFSQTLKIVVSSFCLLMNMMRVRIIMIMLSLYILMKWKREVATIMKMMI